MRFLILTQYFPPEIGAPQIRLMAISRELSKRKHRVTVVTAFPNYPIGRVFSGYRNQLMRLDTVDGIPTIRTWIFPATGRSVFKRLASYWSFTLSSFFGCLRAARPDLILVESPPLFLGLTAYAVSRLRRSPFVLYVSDLWPESAKEMGIIRNRFFLSAATALERFLYRKAHRVAVVTEGIGEQVANAGCPSEHVVLLPNGVDTSIFRRVEAPVVPEITANEIAFLFAGIHGYAQGLDVLLDTAELLRDRPEIAILLIGDGPEKPRLQQEASRRKLSNVRFLNSRPNGDMPVYYSASRASLVPLRSLSLFRSARPSKILPSLACETPVIFCGQGETAELLTRHSCGIVVSPEAPSELATAIRILANDEARAKELGRNGRLLVEERYGWQRIVGTFLDNLGE
jgi:glycosyltransferase involved in cell wall biosynthesis